MPPHVPILSLAALGTPEGDRELADLIHSAFTSSGFLQIVDHGVPASLVDEVEEVSKKLFGLSVAEKTALLRNPETNRGWELLGGQSLDGAIASGHEDQNRVPLNQRGGVNEKTRAVEDAEKSAQDLKEGWMVGKPNFVPGSRYDGRFSHGVNVFPTEEQVPNMERVMADYYNHAYRLTSELLRVTGMSLESRGFPVPEGFFKSACEEPVAAIRLLHYPSQPGKVALGAGQHTDFGLMTLLNAGRTPGLELYTPSGGWETVHPAPGAFIINSGDLLSIFTGDYYKSSLHRVINRSDKDRYSCAFFLDGRSELVIKAMGKEDAKETTVEEHLRARFDVTYLPPAVAA